MTLPDTTLGRQLELLVKGRVDFVLIGGLAVGAWGHVRTTNDVDVIVDTSPDNLERLADLLEDVGGRVVVGDRLLGPDAIATFLRSGDITLVETDLGRIDVVQGVPYVPSYTEAAEKSEVAVIDGVEVRVCSLRHLVEMKRAAGRSQDQADIDGLREAHPEFDWDQ